MFNSSKDIIYFSRFYPDSKADGGCRRTAQIAEALTGLDYEFVSSMDFYSFSYMESPEYSEYQKDNILLSMYLNKWNANRRNDIAFMHFVSWMWQRDLKAGTAPNLRLALVDDPLYFSPLVTYLVSRGVPVVALCHNIETLSSSQLAKEFQAELLIHEIELLAISSLVVTISREETFLLRNFGINTFFYPYYPVKDIFARMMSIREKRKITKKENFLLVGTAFNPPTMIGMKSVITNWSYLNKTQCLGRLLVSGYGTEPLKEFADGNEVVYKGTLPDEELDRILCETKACIVSQSDGAGALTKICEFLLAGVPILANSHAARTYHNIHGVVEFLDIGSIIRAAKVAEAVENGIEIPEPPDSYLLMSIVRDLMDAADLSKVEEMRVLIRQEFSDISINKSTEYIEGPIWRRLILEEAKRCGDVMKAERDVMKAERDVMKAERDVMKAERDAKKAECDALRNSLSWRLTEPLRRVSGLFMYK